MRILIYGIDDKSVALKVRLLNSSHYKVVGFAFMEQVILFGVWLIFLFILLKMKSASIN